MKVFTIFTVLIIVTNLCADLGKLIPSSRLPNQEVSTINPNDTVYAWANSGCIRDIENNDGIIINTFVDVSEEFSNSLDLASLIEDFIVNDGCNILFYFPAGTYEFNSSIDLQNKNNIIFKGESAENTTIVSNEPWYYGEVDSSFYRFSRNNLFNIMQSTNVGFDDLEFQTIAYTTVSTLTQNNSYDGMFIDFDESSSCWISGCRFEKAQRHAILIDNSDHIEVNVITLKYYSLNL